MRHKMADYEYSNRLDFIVAALIKSGCEPEQATQTAVLVIRDIDDAVNEKYSKEKK